MNPCSNCTARKEVREWVCTGDQLHNAFEDFKTKFFGYYKFLGVDFKPNYQCRIDKEPELLRSWDKGEISK